MLTRLRVRTGSAVSAFAASRARTYTAISSNFSTPRKLGGTAPLFASSGRRPLSSAAYPVTAKIDSDRDAIVRLLYSIASRNEVERYLRIFSAANKFAVIKVGGAILTDQLEELALSLSFLSRVGLYPVVIHGMGVCIFLHLIIFYLCLT